MPAQPLSVSDRIDQRRWQGRTIAEWLPEVIADVRETFDPLKIIVFGSVATGAWNADSDIDLLVVLPDAPADEKGRLMGAIRAAIHASVPIDVFVTDPDEIRRRGNLRSSTLHSALREGRIVHERAA